MSVQVKAEVTGVNSGGVKREIAKCGLKYVIFFTSIFRGSLFCGSAVRILEDVIADSGIFDGFQIFCLFFLTPDF